mmetsp:Transcript_19383/g.23092  ORF Transcript_19383/g.23092 Transcript_19383/m.23092 type:complete len:186 (+) Transcript_19383:108-665(+)
MSALSSVRDKASNSIKRAGSAIGIRSSESSLDNGISDEMSEFCPKLTYQQRIYGFGTCFVVGYLITFLSFSFFVRLLEGNPLPFVFLYSAGNIISLLSSMFLCGPSRQFKNMFDEKRKVTTIVYLSALFTSIVICFINFAKGPKLTLLVLLLIVQFFASIWYSLSYIPFARRAVMKCFTNTMNDG